MRRMPRGKPESRLSLRARATGRPASTALCCVSRGEQKRRAIIKAFLGRVKPVADQIARARAQLGKVTKGDASVTARDPARQKRCSRGTSIGVQGAGRKKTRVTGKLSRSHYP
jgi:hypothetical protein